MIFKFQTIQIDLREKISARWKGLAQSLSPRFAEVFDCCDLILSGHGTASYVLSPGDGVQHIAM